MAFKFKDPSTLDFSSNKSEIPPKEEIDFLGEDQLTAIELEKLKTRQQDRSERKKYAGHIFKFIWVWSAGIFLLMILNGCGILNFSPSVLITLLSTTTANVLALFAIVANYLFYRPRSK